MHGMRGKAGQSLAERPDKELRGEGALTGSGRRRYSSPAGLPSRAREPFLLGLTWRCTATSSAGNVQSA